MSAKIPLNLPALRRAYPRLALFVDVSKWQGNINWSQLAPNINGAIIKTTGCLRTGKLHIDGKAQRNTLHCISFARTVGHYHYAKHVTESGAPAPSGAEQAAYFVEETKKIYTARGLPFLPAFLVLDLEPGELKDARRAGWAPRVIEGWVRDFLDTLIRLAPASTRCEVYYSGACIKAADGGLDFLRFDPRFEGWWAGYPSGGPRAEGFPNKPLGYPADWQQPWGAWQFSSDGSSPGVKGDLDLNVCRPGSIFEKIMFGGRGPAQPAPSALGAPLAFLVLASFGWFYKPARRKLQTAARNVRQRLAA